MNFKPHPLLAGLVLLAAASATGAAREESRGNRPGTPAADLLRRVNQERQQRDLPPMRGHPGLARLARLHAADMSHSGILSHLSSDDGASYSQRLARTDLRVAQAAENIGMGSSLAGVHAGLMASPGHRAAILNPDLQEVGIGVMRVEAEGLYWVVQDFARLLPGLSDAAALAALRQALGTAWEAAGAPPPREDAALSRRLATALANMVERREVTTQALTVPPPAWVFAYTTEDPGVLSPALLARAGDARRFAAAVTFQRSHESPLGLFWVALALTQPVKER